MGRLLLLCALALAPALAMADKVAPTDQPGVDLYQERCASCHGTDAKGDGPMASVLKVPPANLTEISKRAGGEFPAARVVETITYGGTIPAHGSTAMPIWGKVFSVEGGGGRGGALASRRAVVELKRYLETIQK